MESHKNSYPLQSPQRLVESLLLANPGLDRASAFHYLHKLQLHVEAKEKNLIKLLYVSPQIVKQSATNLSPAIIANFAYELAKEYNQFYHELPMLKASDEAMRHFRLGLSEFVGNTLKSAMALLGIEVPERM